jgi:hypothetical protein
MCENQSASNKIASNQIASDQIFSDNGKTDRVDYAGAVYGSLLAASVVAGASPRKDPPGAAILITLLLATGVVFWLAHVYARLAGDRWRGARMSWARVRSVGRREWPLAEAAFPPAMVAAICWAVGMSDSAVAWAALVTALCGQVTWAVVASARARAATFLVVGSALVNLLLGLSIVVLKVLVGH